ncbi:kinase-like protein [Gonapodya prolifera JEL478]|uniref:Kinase-like protein n=1 Tax=Gonapodya prolifera (strain JEL478) TaxID=1344416 RepID=A0A139ACG7_GONPJ|nr:kinase-like protein [Gonapodya prolifera JEL478]|eukprot:KXS14467.1 kinase-like protein [Gonapodya prolifera JEL478]
MVPSILVTPPPAPSLPYGDAEIIRGTFGDWQLAPKVLGAGSFATVRKCQDIRTGLKAVAKSSTIVPDSHANHKLYVLRELATLSHLMAVPHPNIVKIFDAAFVGNTVHIIQERVGGIELFDYLKQQGGRLPVHQVRYITTQLLSALHFMHSHHVLHRDIKLDNVLVDPKTLHVTLIDFNLSTFYTDASELAEPVGCINYSSPQILEAAFGRPYKAHMGWSDLWALGVTVYGMLCGFFPFRSEHARKLYAEHTALRDRPVQFVGDHPVHPAAQAFIRRILSLESFGRISAASLLADPFITGTAFAQHETPALESALVAQALRNAVAYSRLFHPLDPVVSTTPELVSPNLAVQEAAVVRHLEATAPGGCKDRLDHLDADPATTRRCPSEETVLSEGTCESVMSETTIGDGERMFYAAVDPADAEMQSVPPPPTDIVDPPAPHRAAPVPPPRSPRRGKSKSPRRGVPGTGWKSQVPAA